MCGSPALAAQRYPVPRMGRETGEADEFDELPRAAPDTWMRTSVWDDSRTQPVDEALPPGYPPEVLKVLGGVSHHLANAELSTQIREIMGDVGAPGETELRVFRAMLEDVAEEGEGDLQRGLLLAWERRTGERVNWPTPVADLWLQITDDRARQRLEHKVERICRNVDDPTPHELHVLEWMVVGLSRRGDGDPVRGLLRELNRDDGPRREPWGERAADLPELHRRAEMVVESLDAGDPNVAGADRLAGRVRADIDGVLADMESGELEASTERVAGLVGNVMGVWAEWQCARERSVRGPVELGRVFKYVDLATGAVITVDVDVSDDGGQRWSEVKNLRPFTTDSRAWSELRRQVVGMVQAAEQNPVDGVARRIAVEFRRGVTPSVAEALAGMGVEVIGSRAVAHTAKERTWGL